MLFLLEYLKIYLFIIFIENPIIKMNFEIEKKMWTIGRSANTVT